MIFDSHVHTEVSTDSEMKLDEAMAAAAAQGIGLLLTEHIDFDFPGGGFVFEPADYFSRYQSYRGDSLLLGVEIGMREEALERNRNLAASGSFDCILGSVHVLEGTDLYEPSFYADRSKQDVYTAYFRAMTDLIKSHDFIDVLGHIDYIARYAPYAEPDIYYHEFTEQIQEVLQTILAQGVIPELNTRRLDSRSALKALLPVYKAYFDCGGRYVTLGSDAHATTALGKDFAAALDLLHACRLKPVYFKGRKMEYMD